jgi:hypothetical protein
MRRSEILASGIAPMQIVKWLSHPKTGKSFNEKTGDYEYWLGDKRVAIVSEMFFEDCPLDSVEVDTMVWREVFRNA